MKKYDIIIIEQTYERGKSMATVTCKYCKQKFNRDKEPYIQIPAGSSFRYGHAQCYLDAVNDGKEKNKYDIWDPSKSTTCFWCHQSIYPDQDGVIPMPQLENRYVHKHCAEQRPQDDKDELTLYLIKLFDLKEDYILPKYMLQLSNFNKDYNFTYSGMLKALKYWYEIKKHPVDRTRGIGIIPYVYKQAYDYYYALFIADQANKEKDLNDYIPKDVIVTIKPPQRQIEKRPLFTFLDEETEDEQ